MKNIYLIIISIFVNSLAITLYAGHTDSFNQAVKREFVEKKTISEDDLIHFILNLDEEVVRNPIAEHKKASGLKFTLAYKQFKRLIQKHEDAINWEAVREFANGLLADGERVQIEKKSIQKKTEVFWEMKPDDVLAMTSENVCAIDNTHHVICWGKGPLKNIHIEEKVKKIHIAETTESLSSRSTVGICAILFDDSIICANDIEPTNHVVKKKGPFSEMASVSSNGYCGVLMSGELECWGATYKAFGTEPLKKGQHEAFSENIKKTVISEEFLCNLYKNGKVNCWGQRFSPFDSKFTRMTAHKKLGSNVIDIFEESGTICAVTSDNKLLCWNLYSKELKQYGINGKDFEIRPEGICYIDQENTFKCTFKRSDIFSMVRQAKAITSTGSKKTYCFINTDNTLDCYHEESPLNGIPDNFISVLAFEDVN